MSEVQRGSISYIIQDGNQCYLCVMDEEAGAFHRFPVNLQQLARLASECAWTVNGALGGYNPPLAISKPVAQEVIG